MDLKTIESQLKAPFASSDVEFRISRVNRNNRKAYVLAYITARAIFDRLDQVFGLDGWQDGYEVLADGVVCNLSINLNGCWITKQDAAPFTNIESLKGGFSDALKRAAVKFGIGRYLYSLPEYCVDLLDKPPYNVDRAKVHYHYSKDVSGSWVEPELPDWALPQAITTEAHTEADFNYRDDIDGSNPVEPTGTNENSDGQESGDERSQLKQKILELLDSLTLQGAVTGKKRSEYFGKVNSATIGVGLLNYFYQQLHLIDKLYALVRMHKVNDDERKQLYRQILSSKMNQFHNIELSLDNLAA